MEKNRVNKICFWKYFSAAFILGAVLTVFKSWFGPEIICAGDSPFYYIENLKDFFSYFYVWDNFGSPASLGAYRAPFSFYYPWYVFYGLFSKLGAGFVLAQRLVWLFPFLFLTVYSSWFFAKNLFPENKTFRFLSPFVYLFNTYILMIIGGGQSGIMMAYGVAPLVLSVLIRNFKKKKFKNGLLAGSVLAFQIVFDPRLSLITLGAAAAYLLLKLFVPERMALRNACVLLVYGLIIPVFWAVLAHAYWLLPTLLAGKGFLPSGFGHPGGPEFLSFARFSGTLSLLHPNWPENIFGKTYFMRPEFLTIPFLAFVALLFVKFRAGRNRTSTNVLFLSILALAGAFMAKGANPPFGKFYLWLFSHFPGMNLFRDSTKFYLLVALAYSGLIPFSVTEIAGRLQTKRFKEAKSFLPGAFLLVCCGCLMALVGPAFSGRLKGTFRTNRLPEQYSALKELINDQDEFFRTLWVPRRQRFGFSSGRHPALNADSFVSETDCQEPLCSLKQTMPDDWGKNCLPNDRCYVRELSYFLDPETARVLSEMAVKYVIVPFDSEGELFVAEREYYHPQREEVEAFLDTIFWLKKIKVGNDLAVYELPDYQDHFFLEPMAGPEDRRRAVGSGEVKDWRMINPTRYSVRLEVDQPPVRLVFSETFDRVWLAKIGEKSIPASAYHQLNSFLINQAGAFDVVIEYPSQKYAYGGGMLSIGTLAATGWYLVGRFRQKKA